MNQKRDDLDSQVKDLTGSIDRILEKLQNIQTELTTVQSEVASKSSEIKSLAKSLRPTVSPTESRERVVTSANEAVQKLSLGKTQDQILGLFLQEVDTFVDRAIVFLNKEGKFTPWKSIGFDAQSIETVVVQKEDDPIVRAAHRQRIIYRSESLDMVFPWLGEAGEIPETSICVPLVFNDYVPLVLYGDSTSPIALDSLELLSHLTVLILKNHYLQMLLDSQTTPAKDQPESGTQPEEVPEEETEKETGEDFLTQMSAAEAANRVDIQEPEVTAEQKAEAGEEVSEEIQESAPQPEEEGLAGEEIPEEVIEEVTEVAEELPEPEIPEAEIPEPEVVEEPEEETPEEEAEDLETASTEPEEEEEVIGIPTDGSVIGEFPTPPFQTDRPALEIVPEPAEPEVVAEIPGESDRLHTEARRFARLLVSEIKLYNESQVDEGRQHRDLYQRLSRDIDRSREMYEKRAHASVRVATDHFHEELVRILAKGEEELLGKDYPGPQVKN